MSNKQFVLVIAVTFVVIIIWIIADIIHTKPSVEVNPKLQELIIPIDPNFDQKVLSQIKEIAPVPRTSPRASTQPVASRTAIQAPELNLQSIPLVPPSPSASSAQATISAVEGTP